jgi:hypothetical protein
MSKRRRDRLPEGDDLLNPAEAAALYNRVVGQGVFSRVCSEETMRRLCRNGELEAAGISVLSMPGRYYISRRSLLNYIVTGCHGHIERAEREMGRGAE